MDINTLMRQHHRKRLARVAGAPKRDRPAIGLPANARSARIELLTGLEQARMPPGPRLEITGGNSNSNTLNRFQPKLRGKGAGEKSHRRITDVDEGSVSDSRADSVRVEPAERLVPASLREIPPHFPKAERAHPAQHGSRARFEQSGEPSSKLLEVIDTIQRSEVRESSIERFGQLEERDDLQRELQMAAPFSADSSVESGAAPPRSSETKDRRRPL